MICSLCTDKGAEMEWIKASASNPSGNCVQLRKDGDWVLVRDSKDPAGPVLRFRWAELDALFQGAALGEFDHLAD